jgi:hypothetical protein
MTMTERKVIKAKVGLLELAKQLGRPRTAPGRGDVVLYLAATLR